MNPEDLASTYRRYLDCLDQRRLEDLHEFVRTDVVYNDEPLGLTGYRQMLANDYQDIPDLHFGVGLLVVDDLHVGCRLEFRCTPREGWLGAGDGATTVAFAEHVFYEFVDGKIARVWSLIDRAAAEAQLRKGG